MDNDGRRSDSLTLFALLSRQRFLVLLVALVAIILVLPFIDVEGTGARTTLSRITLGVLFIAMLLAAVLAVARTRPTVIVAGVLATPAVVMWIVTLIADRPGTELANFVAGSLFLLYVIVVILRYLFATRRVTVNVIAASLCVYLLLAVLWAEIYSIMEIVEPGSFRMPDADISGPLFAGHRINLALYYSLVTMTTLGYGEITPRSMPARSIAAMEAVMGQIYLAVLVARLVGMHIARSMGGDE